MMLKRPPDSDDEVAAVRSPAGVAARRQLCEKLYEDHVAESGVGRQSIASDPLARIAARLPLGVLDKARAPMKFDRFGPITAVELGTAVEETNSRMRAAMIDELMLDELAREESAIRNHPDRMEYARIWNAYAAQVESIAFTKGNQSDAFVRRFQGLMSERSDAEAYADDDAIRSIEARLNRHTAPVNFPVLPSAAWDAADLLPASDRQAELDRLEQKYGPRNAAANGSAKTRTLRKTRTLALTN